MLRLLELMLAIGVVVAALLLVLRMVRTTIQPRPQLPAARWRAAHHSDGTTTRIGVELVRGREVLESRRVEEVLDDNPDYDARFLDAMGRAQSRAALLNSAEGIPEP